MGPIDTTTLPALPAWFGFIEFFKVLGFTLHMVPMNLWYAGVLVAMMLHLRGSDQGRRFSSRLMLQMPIVIAVGINFGIVPLLFLQVAYAKAFYPATILMAWAWLAIIGLLIPAYYGVYVYAFGVRAGGPMPRNRLVAGWVSAAFFIVIGFVFANGLSLTTRVDAWNRLWQAHSVGGAATGTALNVSDPTLWPRWLLMFGFALITTAVWSVVDAFWLARRESDDYRRWAQGFTSRLALGGAIWATVAGGWYVLQLGRSATHAEIFGLPWGLLTLATAASPWVPWGLMWLWRREGLDSRKVLAVAAAQVGVLGLNAITRQVVQNVELRRLFSPGVSAQAAVVQWGPMVMFLLVFVAGVAVVAWIIAQLLKASPSTEK